METAQDPLTGETFYKQRTNQKFASRENQIRYNNKKAALKRNAKAEINNKLDKNRNILSRVLGSKKDTIKSIEYLKGAGFDFFCQTHSCVIDGKKYNCVYDFAFVLEGDQNIKILRHD